MTPSVVQPVGPPASRAQAVEWFNAGVLVDSAGRTLDSRSCVLCGGVHWGGEPCFREVRCPNVDCQSTGLRCRRPSEHDASDWHKARREAFEAECRRRIAAGDLTLPAPWPPARL